MKVLLKTDARRTVQLGNHDPLGSVDDERTALRHQGQFTHVNPLLLRSRLVLQSEGHVERSRKRLPVPLRLVGSQLGFAHFIVRKVEDSLVVVTLNREDFLEDTLQTNDDAPRRRQFLLQKLFVAVELNLNEVGRINDFRKLAEMEAV